MRRYPLLFWNLVLGALGLTWAAVHYLAPYLAAARAPIGDPASLFLPSVEHLCNPEPYEQTRLMLLLGVPSLVMGLGALLARAWGYFDQAESERPWQLHLALVAQLLLGGLGFYYLAPPFAHDNGYRFLDAGTAAITALGAGLFFLAQERSALFRKLQSLDAWLARWKLVPHLLAVFITVSWVLPLIYTTREFQGYVAGSTSFHVSFTFGEYTAAANGLTPLVDFTPQYNNLLPTILGRTVLWYPDPLLSFTVLMGLLTSTGMLCQYVVIRRLFRSPLLGLLGFGAVSAMLHYSFDFEGQLYFNSSANYYAAVPIRFIGPAVLALLCSNYLRRPNLFRLLVLASASTFWVLNNIDHSLIPALACLGVAVLFSPRLKGFSDFASSLLRGAVFAGTAWLSFSAISWALTQRAGSPPSFGRLLSYSKAFGLFGYMSLEASDSGMWWLVALVVAAAAALAFYERVAHPEQLSFSHKRHVQGLLVFTAAATVGPLLYYTGRSHIHTLIPSFGPLAFIGVVLGARALSNSGSDRLGSVSADAQVLRALPMLMTLVLVSPFVLQLRDFRVPVATVNRLNRAVHGHLGDGKKGIGVPYDRQLASLVKRHAHRGEAVFIDAAYGHYLAERLGLKNKSPSAQRGYMLREQLDEVRAVLHALPPETGRVFVENSGEVQKLLAEEGFEVRDQVENFAYLTKPKQSTETDSKETP